VLAKPLKLWDLGYLTEWEASCHSAEREALVLGLAPVASTGHCQRGVRSCYC
jgi:hypothetical protein